MMDTRIETIDKILEKYIDEKKIPGMNVGIRCCDNSLFKKSYGYRQVEPTVEVNSIDTIYDLASLTKIVSTWASLITLLQNNKLHLSTTLGDIFGRCSKNKLADTSIYELLTHTSGISEETYLRKYGYKQKEVRNGILEEGIKGQKGEFRYSNKGFFILGEVVEEITGIGISEYAMKNIWSPLNMKNTAYAPLKDVSVVAPTERDENSRLCKCGIVHDENAEWLQGVSGHAGVFSSIDDMILFCEELIREKPLVLRTEWIDYSMKPHINNNSDMRGLAWRISKYGEGLDLIANHYGFTGTSIWLNRKKREYVVILSNRVHPSRNNINMQTIREEVVKAFWTKS